MNTILRTEHLWTISYEEQFYAVLPWLVLVLLALRQKKQAWIVLLIVLLLSGIRAYMISRQVSPWAIYVLPITHFEAIIGGLIIGLGFLDIPLKKVPAWLFMGLMAFIVVVQLTNNYSNDWNLMVSYPAVGISVSLILLAFLKPGSWFLKTWLEVPWITYLGKISFGLYVFHPLAIYIAGIIAATLGFIGAFNTLFVLIIGFGMTLLIAAISYKWLEKPFLQLKERFTAVESRPI